MRRYLMSRAVARGFLGGSRFWTVLGTLGVAMRVLKKVMRSEPEVVYCERLRPGQSLVISHDRTAKVVQPRR